ncbi:TPA: hypothetical protein ACWWDF_002422 [Enterococcus faecium]
MKYVWLFFIVDTIGTYPELFSSKKKVLDYVDYKITNYEEKGYKVERYPDTENMWSASSVEDMQTDHFGFMKVAVR